ncbi:MAG: tetratricopeptide repeat protein [Saprospiraceae bacterium]
MNEKDFTLIHNYFNGLLSPQDVVMVEQRVMRDEVFKQEFELQKDMEAYPRRRGKRQEFVESLAAVEKEFFQVEQIKRTPLKARVNLRRLIMAAAASVVFLLSVIWLFQQRATPTYEHYAQHDPLSLTLRGETSTAISEAEKAFANENYQKAEIALDQIISTDSSNITARLYKGICQIELNKIEPARATLEPIAEGQSALRSEAIWYIALSYLKEGNYSACEQALSGIHVGDSRSREAAKLMKKLKSKSK